MRKLSTVTGKVYPINRTSINTDQIIPAVWMKKVEASGFADALFEKWRQDPEFILNDPARKGAKIILAGHDFGSGSSREHAVWALRDFGIEAIIAPSIADIHRNNLPSGPLIPAVISEDDWTLLMKIALDDPELELVIDVPSRTITAAQYSLRIGFTLDDSAAHMLISGVDAIDETLRFAPEIAHYESLRPAWMPRTIK